MRIHVFVCVYHRATNTPVATYMPILHARHAWLHEPPNISTNDFALDYDHLKVSLYAMIIVQVVQAGHTCITGLNQTCMT